MLLGRALKCLFFLCLLFSWPLWAQKKTIKLSQKKVAELILSQGSKTKEVNYTYLQKRLDRANAEAIYNWTIDISGGYEMDKSQSFSPSMLIGSRYERIKGSSTLKKTFMTGTIFQIDYNRLSQQNYIDYSANPSATQVPAQQTQDALALTLEQPLLYNFAGGADRSAVNAAEVTYDANELLRKNELESVTLDAIRAFWDAYVAQENFKEGLASRDRYQKLVDSVKRKTSVGYNSPAELVLAQAEFETREQLVKSSSVDYLAKLDNLLTLLNLEQGIDVEFEVGEAIPPLPQMSPVNIDDLRLVKSQKLKMIAADELYNSSQSKSYPLLNLVGQATTTGSDLSSAGSISNTLSGNNPKYYVGLKFLYTFGSDLQTEDLINKKASKDLEESKFNRGRVETQNLLLQAERKSQSTFAIALSQVRQRDFRQKAVQELGRTYNQGRTDIKTYIDAINNYFTSEVSLTRAIGDYQIALNEWAAARDELIKDKML